MVLIGTQTRGSSSGPGRRRRQRSMSPRSRPTGRHLPPLMTTASSSCGTWLRADASLKRSPTRATPRSPGSHPTARPSSRADERMVSSGSGIAPRGLCETASRALVSFFPGRPHSGHSRSKREDRSVRCLDTGDDRLAAGGFRDQKRRVLPRRNQARDRACGRLHRSIVGCHQPALVA